MSAGSAGKPPAPAPKEPIWKPPSGPLSEDQRLAGIRTLIQGGSAGFRRAVVGVVLHEELEAARSAYARAHEAGEAYKAHLIRLNANTLKGVAERFGEAWEVLGPLGEIAVAAVHAAGIVEDRVRALQATMTQLREVCGPWRDTRRGLEAGVGLSGFDESDAVKAVQAEVTAIHERWVAAQVKRDRDGAPKQG